MPNDDNGKGNRPQAARELTVAEKDKLFASGEFGTSDPTLLLTELVTTIWKPGLRPINRHLRLHIHRNSNRPVEPNRLGHQLKFVIIMRLY